MREDTLKQIESYIPCGKHFHYIHCRFADIHIPPRRETKLKAGNTQWQLKQIEISTQYMKLRKLRDGVWW